MKYIVITIMLFFSNLLICNIFIKREVLLQLPDDKTSHVGRYTNVRIDDDDSLIVAFNDEKNNGIRMLRFLNRDLKKHTSIVIDKSSLGDNARFIRMEINPVNKQPYFTYTRFDRAVMLVFCVNKTCEKFKIIKIHKNKSSHSSIAFKKDGSPVIAFKSKTGLKMAFCKDQACSTFRIVPLINQGGHNEIGKYASVYVDDNDIPVLSFYDTKFKLLKFARCTDETCKLFNISIIDSGADLGKYNFMRLLDNKKAFITYTDVTNGYLKTAYCLDPDCNFSIISIIDKDIGKEKLARGIFPEIGVSPKTKLPVISYVAQPQAGLGILKLAFCQNESCTSYKVQEIARDGFGFGRDSSMAFKNDLIYLTFLDYNNNDRLAKLMVLSIFDLSVDHIYFDLAL